MIDFRIDTFVVVCKYMNYTKAAQELHITQPAVSQHIRYLEQLYQAKLFYYNNKKISLTEVGEMLLSAAMTMKHDERYLIEQMKNYGSGIKSLTLGVTLTVGEYCIPQKIASYIKEHPGTQVKILVENTQELLQKLSEGIIDFAIVEGNFAKTEYDYECYSKQELIPVCACNHTFTYIPKLVEDLLCETVLVRERESGGREVLERSLEGKNLRLSDFDNQIEVSSIHTIKELTAEDCGITFLYEAAVLKDIAEGRLKKIVLEDFRISHDITFIWQKGSIYTEQYRALYQVLKP